MAGKDFNDLLDLRFLGVLVLARKLAGEQGRIQLQADDVPVLAREVAVELGVTGLDCEVIQRDPVAELDEVGQRPCPRVDVPRIDADPSRTHPVSPEEVLRIPLVVGVFHVVVGHGPIGRLADKGLDHATAGGTRETAAVTVECKGGLRGVLLEHGALALDAGHEHVGGRGDSSGGHLDRGFAAVA